MLQEAVGMWGFAFLAYMEYAALPLTPAHARWHTSCPTRRGACLRLGIHQPLRLLLWSPNNTDS